MPLEAVFPFLVVVTPLRIESDKHQDAGAMAMGASSGRNLASSWQLVCMAIISAY